MREPGLQATVALSAVLHVTVFLLAALVLRQSNNMALPSPYIVSLMGPSGEARNRETGSGVESVQQVTGPEKPSSAVQKDNKADQKLIEERISELQAKQKIHKIVEVRKKVTEIKVKATSAKPAAGQTVQKKGTGGGLGAAAMASYTDMIIKEIHDQWFYPETGDRNLETIVSVKILKDGTIKIMDMEKKSGSRIFDSSALKAIHNASPVTRPPFEMEIGIRFYP